MDKLIRNDKFSVLTPSGFKTFDSLRKCQNILIEFELETGKSIKVTPLHRFTVYNVDIFAKDLYIGDRLDTVDGLETVVGIKHVNELSDVYDLMNVDCESIYYTNDIVSHNSFLATSFNKLIIGDKINEYRKYASVNEHIGRVIEFRSRNKQFQYTQYHPYDPKRTYLISADPSEGMGQDSAVAYIWDITDYSNIIQCGVYSDPNTPPAEFAFVLNMLANCYGKPFMAIESNSIGRSVLDMMRDVYEYEYFVRMDKKNQIGIRSHVQIKSKACLWVQELVGTPEINLHLYDMNLIDEMDSFIKKETTTHTVYNAMKGKHDDHIMCMIWGLWVFHPDNIEHYFSVFEYMTTGLGKTIPSLVAPLYGDIDTTDIKKTTNDILRDEWNKEKADINNEVSRVLNQEEVMMEDAKRSREVNRYDEGDSFSFGFIMDNDPYEKSW